MYERFTDRSRKVMQLANLEAQRFNHEYVGTDHILLSLVKEGSGVAANESQNLDVDLRKIRVEVEKIVQTGPGGFRATIRQMPHTPRAKKAIEYAVQEARQLHHDYVGTEHLLLGLLREQVGMAAQALMNLGVKLEDVREEVQVVLNQPQRTPGERVGSCLGRIVRRLFGRSSKMPPSTGSETRSDKVGQDPTNPSPREGPGAA